MPNKFLIKFESLELKSLLAARYFMHIYNIAIFERKKKFSFDGSFTFEGKSFDCGYHAIDVGRSLLYNGILNSVGIEWIKSPSTRSLVINDKKYNRGYHFKELKEDFSPDNKFLFKSDFLLKLEQIYGSDFVRFSIENIAKSYFQNQLWINNNLSDEIKLTNIYPWFFPLSPKDELGNLNKLRPHFHNKTTENNLVMYPKSGSFGSITSALKKVLEEVIIESQDSEYRFASFDENGKLSVDKDTFHIWPIDYHDVASRFNLELPDFTESYFYLISVVLEVSITFTNHEILVGDKNYYIDRVSSPESLSGKNLVSSLQFECETLTDISEERLIKNIRLFTTKFLDNPSWSKFNIKKVRLKRYNPENVDIKVKRIIDFVESKNPQLIVLNRHLVIENLSNSLEVIVERIKDRIINTDWEDLK